MVATYYLKRIPLEMTQLATLLPQQPNLEIQTQIPANIIFVWYYQYLFEIAYYQILSSIC